MTSWIVPCNPEKYDIKGALQKLIQIDWHQKASSIETGDIVYIYVSKPYQKILFQCVVVKTNMDDYEIDDRKFVKDGAQFLNEGPYMRVHLVKKLDECDIDLKALRIQGLKGNIQGPRRVDGELLEYIEKTIDANMC